MKIKLSKIVKSVDKVARAIDAASKPAPKPAPKAAAKPAAKPTPKPEVKKQPVVAPVVPPTPAASVTPSTTIPPVVDDFAGITDWHGGSRGTWPVTVQISNARVEGGNIVWDEVKGQREARKWNVFNTGKAANGETNLVIPSIKAAGCFDYLGVNQTRKTTGNLLPSKDGKGKGMFAPWNPKKGDRVGFYIATISREKSQAKMQERSNVVWFTWP